MCHCLAISSQCSPMLLPVARLATLGMCRPKSFQRKSREPVDAVAETARRPEPADPVRHALRQSDLHAAHALHAAAQREIDVLAEHARGFEHRDHAGGTGEHGAERGRRLIDARIDHDLAGDVAPSEIGHYRSPYDEVGARARGQLRRHRFRDGNGQADGIEIAQSAIDARKGRANTGYKPGRHAGLAIGSLSVPSAATVAALEPLAVARELLLELFAALLGDRHALRLVLVERLCRLHAGDVVATEDVRKLLRAKAIEPRASPASSAPCAAPPRTSRAPRRSRRAASTRK